MRIGAKLAKATFPIEQRLRLNQLTNLIQYSISFVYIADNPYLYLKSSSIMLIEPILISFVLEKLGCFTSFAPILNECVCSNVCSTL